MTSNMRKHTRIPPALAFSLAHVREIAASDAQLCDTGSHSYQRCSQPNHVLTALAVRVKSGFVLPIPQAPIAEIFPCVGLERTLEAVRVGGSMSSKYA
jgi:hypothetical protein